MGTGFIALLRNAIFMLIFIAKIARHLFSDPPNITLWSYAAERAYSLNGSFCEPDLKLADLAGQIKINIPERVFSVTPLGIESGAPALTPYLVADSFRSPPRDSVNH